MKTFISIIILLLFTCSVYSENIVQIATTRDSQGQFNNWTVQAVTWDATIITTIPAHYAYSNKVGQTWAFPIEGGYLRATFPRNILGEYAIRWSTDGEFWSNAVSVIIIRPGVPINTR